MNTETVTSSRIAGLLHFFMIADHGLLPENDEHVLANHEAEAESRSSDRPCVFGCTEEGRYIIAVCDQIDNDTVCPACSRRDRGSPASAPARMDRFSRTLAGPRSHQRRTGVHH
jgi:hypothetical protein